MTEKDIQGLELNDDHYTVVQALIRNRYKAVGDDGDVVLKGKQKMLKLKEEFPFEDADGNPVFEVKAEGILDVAGDYVMRDLQSEEELVVLDKNYTFATHEWKLRDPDTEALIGKIESQGTLVPLLRSFSSLANLFPHKYNICNADDEVVGTIEGQFSIQDKYDVNVADVEENREVMVAAAMVIDAIEAN